MSDPIESKNPEFLVELSEPEQESVAGGFALEDMFESFFFQQTDIDTFAEAQFNDSQTGRSSLQRTGYRLSQITLAFTSPRFGGGRSRYRRSRRMGGIFNLLRGWES